MPGWCAAGRGRARACATRPATAWRSRGRRGCPSIWAISRANSLRGHAARFIDDRARLACLSSAAAMAEATLPEREPHPRAYAGLNALLEALDEDQGYAALYVRWELDLLAELGYGLDLSHCVATGAQDHLTYVSPRSGQAVSEDRRRALSREAAAPAALPPARREPAARAGRHPRRPRPHRLLPRSPRAGAPRAQDSGCALPIR